MYEYGFVYACGYTWEEKIIPLEVKQAKELLAEMGEVDAYNNEFGVEE